MAVHKEEIQIILTYIEKGRRAYKAGIENLTRYRAQVRGLMSQIGMRAKFTDVLGMEFETWRDLNRQGIQYQRTGAKIGNRVRKMTHGMRGFRMEMLSVMFFGMGIQRMFMGWLQPAMQAYGIFDLFQVMLLTLFLPVMQLLFPILMSIMDWFMNLPEPVKMVIGIIAVVGTVFGTILAVIGALVLGIGGLVLAWPLVVGAIGAVIGILAPVIIIIAAVIAIVALLWLMWKYNFGKIREHTMAIFNAIKSIFEGIIQIFQGLWDIMIGIVELDGSKIREGFNKIWEGVKKIFIDGIAKIYYHLYAFIWDAIKSIAEWGMKFAGIIADWLGKAWQHFTKWISGIGSAFVNWAKDAWDYAVDFAQNLISGFTAWASNVANAIFNMIPEPFRSAIRYGKNIVVGIASDIIGGVRGFLGLQRGGIVRKPTIAALAERGIPEAVIPLDKIGKLGMGQTINYSPTYHFDEVIIKEEADYDEFKRRLQEDQISDLDAMLRR